MAFIAATTTRCFHYLLNTVDNIININLLFKTASGLYTKLYIWEGTDILPKASNLYFLSLALLKGIYKHSLNIFFVYQNSRLCWNLLLLQNCANEMICQFITVFITGKGSVRHIIRRSWEIFCPYTQIPQIPRFSA